jgi:hypothetical protein
MYSTTAYLYQQKTRVLAIDTGGDYFTYRYNPVYAKRLTINKGVDNVILFEFINQDEKPVNITGSTMIFRAISQDGAQVLIEEPMVILNAATGRAKVTLTMDQLYEIQAQPANYSISRTSGNLTEAVFTDAQAGARAPVDIVDSVLPEFVPSSELTIPTLKTSAQLSYDGSNTQNYPDWAGQYGGGSQMSYYSSYQNTEFFSSFIEPRSAVTTVQMDLVGYTGTIKAQGAENYQSIWYNVTESTTYLNRTETIYMNIIGWHPILRLCFNNSVFASPEQPGTAAVVGNVVVANGVVQSISIQSGGSGYLAPPKIDIIGNGAGAQAVATLGSDGSVAGITVTEGGSGYWPVPPGMQGAVASINTGFVTNLLYR